MGDIESDFMDYEIQKSNEGGLHTGRRNPTKKLLRTLAIVLVLLALGIALLVLIPRN